MSKLESGSEPPELFASFCCRCCCSWFFVGACTRGGRNGRFTDAECRTLEDEADAARVIPSARRDPCEEDSNDWDAVVVDPFVVVDTDAPRRGSDSGVISAAGRPAPFLLAASGAGSLVGVGVSGCGHTEARETRDGGACDIDLMDVATAATGFGWSAGCSGGRRVVRTGRTGVGEDDSAHPWESSAIKERGGTCRVTPPPTAPARASGSTFIMSTSFASASVRGISPTACDGETLGGMMGRLE